MTLDDDVIDGVVVDISRDGAKFVATGVFDVGSAVILIMDDVAIPALVHWSADGHTGLRFLDRLDSATLLVVEQAADMFAPFR